MDIVTVTYNPCLDITCWVSEFGEAPYRTEAQTGGKGVNCARVISSLGGGAVAVCPLGGDTGVEFKKLAADEGITLAAVGSGSPTRVITTYARGRDCAQRVDYQKGEPLSGDVTAKIEAAALEECKKGARVLAVCGSAPDEKSAEGAYSLLVKAKKLGVKTVLDSNGAALSRCVGAEPDLIKPNEDELFFLTGESDISRAASMLLEKGVGAVLVSLGTKGCMFASTGIEEYHPGVRVDTVNAVGSGDSFLGAFLYSSVNGASLGEACVYANAAGAANAMMFPAARIKKADVERLLECNGFFGAY